MAAEPYELYLAGEPRSLRVVRYRAREALSALYCVRARCTIATGSTLAATAIGRAATMVFHLADGHTRFLQGIVTASRTRGSGTEGAAIDLVVEPRLSRLKHRSGRRIFQDVTAVDVVLAVLAEHGISARNEVIRDLPVRPYCVQLDETDLQFAERLLAEEGIFYLFEHEAREVDESGARAPVETLVLASATTSYTRLSPKDRLIYRDEGGDGGLLRSDDTVYAARLSRRARPEHVALAGLDFSRPGTVFEDAAHSSLSGVAGGVAIGRTTHELSYETLPKKPGPASMELEQERRDVTLFAARSTARHLAPGGVFTLGEALDPDLCTDWAVIRVEHRGTAAGAGGRAWDATFRAVPAKVPYRPERISKPVCSGVETATVVGPESDPVYTDGHGRVRVRFPWDSSTTAGDRASTWLRVAQAWAGTGFGAQFIPRVGSEVLVGFIGGDPDRPVVVGGLYDGQRPYPFSLPREKTQSGIRTTTVGGKGSNELMFEDKVGGELLSLRGQRNVAISAGADYSRATGGASRVDVSGKSELSVGGDRNESVAGARRVKVQGSLEESTGTATLTRAGTQLTHVNGDRFDFTTGGAQSRVASFLEVLVGTGGAAYHNTTVQGTSTTRSTDSMFFGSNASITLEVGESKLVVGPQSITLRTPKLRLDADEIGLYTGDGKEYIEIGDGVRLKADSVISYSSGATLTLDGEAELKSGQIKLKSGKDSAPDKAEEAEDETGTVTFKIDNFDPSKSCTVLVMTPTGEIEEMTPDGSGTLQIEGRPGDRYSVVDIRYNGRSVAKKTK